METKRPIDLLKAAVKGETIEVKINLPGIGEVILDYGDAVELYSDQSRRYDEKRAEYYEKGFDKHPINEKKWNAYTKLIKPERRARIEADRPENLAEQMADEDTRLLVIKEYAAKCLRDKDGNQIFSTKEEQEEFGRMALVVPKIREALFNGITELFEKADEVNKQVKNSSKGESSTNGGSGKPGQEDSGSTPGRAKLIEP